MGHKGTRYTQGPSLLPTQKVLGVHMVNQGLSMPTPYSHWTKTNTKTKMLVEHGDLHLQFQLVLGEPGLSRETVSQPPPSPKDSGFTNHLLSRLQMSIIKSEIHVPMSTFYLIIQFAGSLFILNYHPIDITYFI